MDVNEIKQQRFTVQRRGYKPEEVDTFMDNLIVWAEAQNARITELESLYAQREDQIFHLQEKNVQLSKENAALLERPEPQSEPQPCLQNDELKQQMQMLLSNAHEVAAKIQQAAQEQAIQIIEQADAAALQRKQETDERQRQMDGILALQAGVLEKSRETFTELRTQYEKAFQEMTEKQRQAVDQLSALETRTMALRSAINPPEKVQAEPEA